MCVKIDKIKLVKIKTDELCFEYLYQFFEQGENMSKKEIKISMLRKLNNQYILVELE